GAFVELAKGTDGLLHISNIAPGKRIDTVEDVLNKGDEVEVKVVEVDRERGRIGLRLADDPDVVGKSVEELAAVGSGDRGPRGGDRGPRGGGRGRSGDRDRDRSPRGSGRPRHRDPDRAWALATEHRLTELDTGVRVVTEAMPSVRSVALGFWVGTGS